MTLAQTHPGTAPTPPGAAMQPERRLISIASGKGGVGKTWFAISLAHALAAQGRKVLLFDGDLGLANVDVQLGLQPAADVGDVLSGARSVAEAVTHYRHDTATPFGIDVLAGRSGSGALSTLGREALVGLRQTLIAAAPFYDDVVLDLGAGIEQSVMALTGHGGRHLVVTTPEPTALTDAYAFIKVKRLRDPNADIRVVVNSAAHKAEGEATYQTLARSCTAFLKMTPALAGIIRRDTKVGQAIRAQTPLLLRHPESQAVADVAALAARLRDR